MIDIDKLKKGDIFFKSGTNGVLECIMEDEKIQKFGSFGVKIKERGNKLGIITKEDYQNLYYSREEAEVGCQKFPTDNLERLLKDDKWLEDLFYVYKSYMPETYVKEMQEAIREKTGKTL